MQCGLCLQAQRPAQRGASIASSNLVVTAAVGHRHQFPDQDLAMAFAVPIATNASMPHQIHAHQPVPAHQHASSHAYSGRLGTPGALRDAPVATAGCAAAKFMSVPKHGSD